MSDGSFTADANGLELLCSVGLSAAPVWTQRVEFSLPCPTLQAPPSVKFLKEGFLHFGPFLLRAHSNLAASIGSANHSSGARGFISPHFLSLEIISCSCFLPPYQ